MSSLLIQNVLLPSDDRRRADVLIEGSRISKIGSVSPADYPEADLIEGDGLAIIPGFVNGHTHSAMTFFRGYGDDLNLMDWLNNMIWPVEAHLTEEDIYWGARVATLEMIKSGTTAFLDMYTLPEGTARAVEESGLRANLSYTLFDRWDEERAALDRKRLEEYLKLFSTFSDRVQLSVGPHAIYTVSAEQLKYGSDFAKANGLLVHLHLSETYTEWRDCCEKYGTTPVRFLDQIGVLSDNLVLAHGLWLDSEEIRMLADHGCSVVHNPASNMKLASGSQFRYEELRRRGVRVGLGTDGVSSSNNLDMITAMKCASFMGKSWSGDPTVNKAGDLFDSATRIGADILCLESGRIEEGYLADVCLVDLSRLDMTPTHSLISNLVYATNGDVIDTTIVDGKVLMRHRDIPGEREIRERFEEVSKELFRRSGIAV